MGPCISWNEKRKNGKVGGEKNWVCAPPGDIKGALAPKKGRCF